MTDLHQLVCDECGDCNIIVDAWASMNSETGKIEFEESLDNGFCRTCEDDIQYRYTYKINGKEAPEVEERSRFTARKDSHTIE